MARRIRWQIIIAFGSMVLIVVLLTRLALENTAVASPLTGGTYVEVVDGVPQQLNPLLNDPLRDPVGRDIAALVFSGLTRIGGDGLPAPALARSWQSDPTGEVYTFNLREDVVWHDGRPFTADDVVFTLRAIQDGDFPGDPALANLWRNVLVDRIDDYAVRFTLNAPYAPFPAMARVPILPAHVLGTTPLEQWAAAPFARAPVGTGPFRLVELSDNRAVLEANPTYLAGRPFLDQIELRFFETREAGLAVLAQGEATAMGAREAQALIQVNLPRTFQRIEMPRDGYTVLTFNLRRSPLDSLPFRQALARGIDKDLLVATATGGVAQRLDTPILPGWWAYDPGIEWYAFDPASAERALTELGYERGPTGERVQDGQLLRLPLITDSEPARLAAAEAVAAQLATLGVTVAVEEVSSEELRRRLREHEFGLAIHSWARLGPDPDVFELWHSAQANNGLNYAGLRDEQIDTLLASARTTEELAARADDYAAFQERWVELAPSITLFQPLYVFAFDEQLGGGGLEQPELGPQLLFGHEDRYREVERWFLVSSREIRGNLR